MQTRVLDRILLFRAVIKNYNKKHNLGLNHTMIYVLLLCKKIHEQGRFITASSLTEELKRIHIPLRSRQVYKYLEFLERVDFLILRRTNYKKQLEKKFYSPDTRLIMLVSDLERHTRKQRMPKIKG